MCNIYRIGAKRGMDKGVLSKIAAAVGKLPSSLVRISDPGTFDLNFRAVVSKRQSMGIPGWRKK